MKLKYWPKYLAHHALCYCRDFVAPAYKVEPVTADFFVSMGANCRTAIQLRRNKLRICSSPLDWMTRYTLRDASELFATGFSSFFTDIREHTDQNGGDNRIVEDSRNGMLAIHHFPSAIGLEEGHCNFKKVVERRFSSTHEYMKSAERIVMVTNSTESIDTIRHFIIDMQALYKAELIHINIRDGVEKKRERITLPNRSILYDYTFHDVAFSGIAKHQGNEYEWRRILSKCRRTRKFSPQDKTIKESYD